MRKYNTLGLYVPREQRPLINTNILMLIDSGDLQGVTPEEIFNSYTGDGGLHGLQYSNFKNFHEYTDAKKEIEQGQFFTPYAIAEQMASLIDLKATETIADITAGAGIFANFFPERNFYGCEIDPKAYKIARFLYPETNVELKDLRFYYPGNKFDFIIGNFPFNLAWDVDNDTVRSQDYCFKKCAELLRPAGLIVTIVPASYCADDFANKSEIERLNKNYNFLGQCKLPRTAFANVGVMDYATKIICLQKKSEHLEELPYNTGFVKWEQLQAIFAVHLDRSRKLKIKANAELALTNKDFYYKVKKYLYELKAHKPLQQYLPDAMAYLDKYHNQQCPPTMKYDEWYNKHRVTSNMVLAYMKRRIMKQCEKEEHKIDLVKTQYGFKFKAYSHKVKHALDKTPEKVFLFNTVLRKDGTFQPIPALHRGYRRLVAKKAASYKLHDTRYRDLKASPAATSHVKRFRWISPKGLCHFNKQQAEDLAKISTKDYSILNWQQGSGKSPAAYAWSKYKVSRHTVIVSTGLAINRTWAGFLKLNKETHIEIRSLADLAEATKFPYILISHDFMIKYQRHIKKFAKLLSNKISVILDESDEITNHTSKRTRAIKDCFQRARYKLLTTGTTTRNNITELYSQIEFLYNNSINMICDAQYHYVENYKTKELERMINDREGLPFPPRRGNTLFKQCFNPSKATVFGIQKHDQSIYNEDALRHLIEKTIITRKFKEIAGDKYDIGNIEVHQNPHERQVYRIILKEFHTIVNQYFRSTGSARKDAGLRIVRQIQLLIDATSAPQFFKEYQSRDIPNKAHGIFKEIERLNTRIAIGCTKLDTVHWYETEITRRYPDRPVFVINGSVTFRKRGDIIDKFQESANGILICTQQSLKSSVNIPECNEVFIESKQWNIPKIEQFFFRFIRFDSSSFTRVRFFSYASTIETNLMALLMAKEKLNDYIKTLEYRENSDIYEEYDIDIDILNDLITKEYDDDGKVQLRWGKAELA